MKIYNKRILIITILFLGILSFNEPQLNGQSRNVGLVDLDSLLEESIINKLSSDFCNKISSKYLFEVEILLDSLQKEMAIHIREVERIHAPAEYFEPRCKKIIDLQEQLISSEELFVQIQNILNVELRGFILQEVFRNLEYLKRQWNLKLLATEKPIYFNKEELIGTGSRLLYLTSEMIEILNRSGELEKNWEVFKLSMIRKIENIRM